jgi:hypothetical protein
MSATLGRIIGGTFLSGTIVGIAHDFAFASLPGPRAARVDRAAPRA